MAKLFITSNANNNNKKIICRNYKRKKPCNGQEAKSHFWNRKPITILMTTDQHSAFSFCAQSSHIHMIIAQNQKIQRIIVGFILWSCAPWEIQVWRGSQAERRHWDAVSYIRGSTNLHVPDVLPTFWGLIRALWDPPLRGCILSSWKLPGSLSAEFYAHQQRVEFLQMPCYSLAVFLHCINILHA